MKTEKTTKKILVLLLTCVMATPLIAEREIPIKENEWLVGKKSLGIRTVDAYVTDGDQSIRLSFYKEYGTSQVSVLNQETGEIICTEVFSASIHTTKEILFPQPLETGCYLLEIQYQNGLLRGGFVID